MKRFWTATAVAFLALGMVAGCNDYNTSIQYNTGASLTSISPSGLPAGTPSSGTVNCPNTPTGVTNPCFTLFIQANASNGFTMQTVAEWNGQKLVTTYVDTTDVSAQVPYSLLAKAGTAYVNTYTPQSGTGMNGLSNALTFLIYGAPNPVPSLSSISPTSAGVCTTKCANVPLTLTGTNFLATSSNGASKVTYTGVATSGIETAITVTSITATQIQATIPGTYLSAADAAQINVINPPSAVCLVNCPNLGGGDTNCIGQQSASQCVITTQTFTISAASGGVGTASLVAEETPAVSQDGRYVAFTSLQNGISQILMRDTCLGAANGCTPGSRVISAAADGSAGNGESHAAAMSADGRYVGFSSAATNLVEGAPAGRQVYLRDTCVGTAKACQPSTQLISTDEAGAVTGTEGILPSVSASGRFVAFVAVTPSAAASEPKGANATNAMGTPNSGLRQVFVRDTCLGAANCKPKTTRISLQPGDGTGDSSKPAGPALSGLAKQIALTGGKNSTVFTPTVPIDDRVFLAIPSETK